MPQPFNGFFLPTSNTTYTPNQFFDVCLPYQSRGVVRLVGYMIRKTLGWCDAHGNPQHETVSFSYNELERHAGVSHSMIRLALDQAVAAGFIRCVRKGEASTRSMQGQTATYELQWDEGGQYVKDPKTFAGFFAGEGNRTYIPNQFFDVLLVKEPLATIQAVGAIIRFSIGFVNKYGHRRQRVALSYRDIQRYTKLRSPRMLNKAIREAIARNYIERLEAGYFDPNGGALSRSAHYAVKWVGLSPSAPTTPKSEAGGNHSEKVSGGTPKSEAADHSEKVSDIQMKQLNNISKQQADVAATIERLKAEGFDTKAAKAIASQFSRERVERQIAWLPARSIKSNRLGLLRAAIAEDWQAPTPVGKRQLGRPNSDRNSGMSFGEALAQARRRLIDPKS